VKRGREGRKARREGGRKEGEERKKERERKEKGRKRNPGNGDYSKLGHQSLRTENLSLRAFSVAHHDASE
jgi:hypothetical protein